LKQWSSVMVVRRVLVITSNAGSPPCTEDANIGARTAPAQ
jgi:hypothetical protein